MSQVVEHLAELTGYRDRDVLDVTLVGALKDVLRPLCAAIYRSVGDPGDERWLTRARQRAEDPAATADPLWAELDSLPKLGEFALRRECLRLGQLRVQEPAAGGSAWLSIFPLSTDREVVGVMELETALPLSHDDEKLVRGILRVYRNFQGLLDYSERDTLTGLLNRKTFDDAFMRSATAMQDAARLQAASAASAGADGNAEGEVERRRTSAVQAWLGVIDIDHFKNVNDSFGHLIGDEVLLLLSRLMRSCFRLHDQLYRFGGEEFVVLLRAQHADAAAAAFERLRATVANYNFPQVGRITVSAGFTAVRTGDTPSGAFERADKCVYYAKQHGRNQVASHAELLARGVFADDTRSSDMELF
jgi:diguanylate cyclase (GGDEF)-like protein